VASIIAALILSIPVAAHGQTADAIADRDAIRKARLDYFEACSRGDTGRGSNFGGGYAHRVFTAAQNCSVTAFVSSVTFQPSLSALSLAKLSSI
jgi:hypothetical protein